MRFGGVPAAVFAHTVAEGLIASSSGSAMLAPTPFNTVRREMCFLNNVIAVSPFVVQASGLPWSRPKGLHYIL
jgi:hypothetical protein